MACDPIKPGAIHGKVAESPDGFQLANRADANSYADKPHLRLDLDLTVAPPAPGYRELRWAGSVIWVNKTVGATAEIQVAFNEDGEDQAVFLQAGYFLRGKPFEKLRLYWSPQFGVTMTLILFRDRPGDTVGIL